MNILYSCDDKFSAYTGISITSLFENNKELSEINVFITGQGVSEENIAKLKKTAENYGRSITILDTDKINKFLVDNDVTEFHGSRAPFYRIFIDELFDQSINRVLYIDSDTVIVGSLADLESLTFDPDNVCAMIRDPIFTGYNTSIGLDENDLYFCTGVLLFELDNWRRLKCNDLVMQAIKEGHANYRFADQDLLCLTLKNRIQTLEYKYDILAPVSYLGAEVYRALNDADDSNFYTIQEINEAQDNPRILHCVRGLTGAPWEVGNFNPFKDEWVKYKKMSLWHDIGEIPNPMRTINAIQRVLFKVLPKKLYIPIHKFYSKKTYYSFMKKRMG